jgi:predicted alpha/beta superfamily hydrolase
MTKNSIVLMLMTVLTFFLSGLAFAGTNTSVERTKVISLESKTLNETREIFTRTPQNYDPENKEYPVVYVLDGEWNFEYVAGYLDYMFSNNTYPDMIVTGVRNVNRNRDYVPRPDIYFEDTGEADKFLKFVKNEWIEEIEKNYPTSDERIIIGHSFGGVFTLHILFSDPALFDAYIALGSSAWIADGVLLEEARTYFANPEDADAFVYMAVGEGDGGPTVPSSRELAGVFEKNAPESLEWTFEITPKTDHFKNFASGMHDAFMALFPAWGFAGEVLDAARKAGAEGVNEWFKEKHGVLGMRFQPSWFDLGVAAFTLTQEEHGDAAIALMDNLKSYYPKNGRVANFAASVFEMNEQYEEALQEYERAIEIVTEQKLHPNTLHKGSLERGAERVREQLAKSDNK